MTFEALLPGELQILRWGGLGHGDTKMLWGVGLRWLLLGGMVWFTVSGLAACSAETRQKILPFFFDGVPSAGTEKLPPPTRRVRRDLLREIEELKRELAATQAAAKAKQEGKPTEGPQGPVERATRWEEAAEALPRDIAGNVDWVQAIKAGAIAPRPGVDPKTPEQAALDLDVELASSASRLFSVTYAHSSHTQWLTCGNCHPAIFPLTRRAEPTVITMAKIQAGQYCGFCHGRVAFGIQGECTRCHAKIPAKADWRPAEEPRKPIERAKNWDEAARFLPVSGGSPDWVKALAEGVIAPRPGIDPKVADQPVFPITVERVPSGQPAFKAVFPHEAHTSWLGCDSCHPAIFRMSSGATPVNMALMYAGQSCGACHGKVAFPVTACGRCHPAMAGGS